MRQRSWFVIAVIALAAITAWPFLAAQRANASRPYVAPVLPDYLYRDETVAFYERRIREDPQDQISARMLAGEYMQRYRESLDVGDIVRALHQAQRALVLQPQNNAGALGVIGSAYYALHDFRAALRYETAAHYEEPNDPNPPAQMALLEMEMGNYELVAHDLTAARRIQSDDPSTWAAQARYDELSGRNGSARRLMSAAAAQSDEVSDNSAEARAWYHYRLGEMAFATGDVGTAQREERLAISQFPNFEMAYRALARLCWAAKDWNCALDAAKRGADILPEPETLGYEADAQAALGDATGARQTQALIFAVERIGNAYRINDRLLSVYYSEHGVRLDDSLRIARREVQRRGKEVFAQDTLAWAAAMDGHWNEAYAASLLATRLHTEDPRILFHAGMIASHFGKTGTARQQLRQALALNPKWDPFYADEARAALKKLRG